MKLLNYNKHSQLNSQKQYCKLYDRCPPLVHCFCHLDLIKSKFNDVKTRLEHNKTKNTNMCLQKY